MLERLLCVVAAAVLVGMLAMLADAVARDGWHGVSIRRHTLYGIGLYSAVAAFVGLVAGLSGAAAMRFERRTRARWPRWRRTIAWLVPLSAALAGAFAFRDTIEWTFSGIGVRATTLARWGPQLFMLTTAVGFGALVACLRFGLRAVARGKALVPALLSALLLAAAGALVTVDLTVFVALYSRLHEMVEAIAAAVALSALSLMVALVRTQLPRMRMPVIGIGGAAIGWLALFVASSGVRARVDEALTYVLEEEVYLGRMLLRVQLAEAYLRDPSGWKGARASRLARLKQRFDISSVALSPIWTKPVHEPRETRAALRELRQPVRDYNIVVFYVDTLRDDVATDPTTMPNTVAFAKKSLDFRRSYSFASDTENALPVLITGSYAPEPPHGNVMERARAEGLSTALFIARSAHRFVEQQVPSFRFEQTIEVVDYESKKDVWGYGADRPSAIDVTDEALAWIDGRTSERFFAWLFHFDVHNWRELNDEYIERTARHMSINDEDSWQRRYRASAAGVDEAFGRFLKGLEDRKLADRTIVLFVSDHGEGLGRRGHIHHAVFLWESLVRTPLLLHVPGMAPAAIDTPVGQVDVAPTLARFFDPDADVSHYHGHDLMRHTLPGTHPDGLPLLLKSMRKDDLLRVGLIERHAPYHKLVLPLDSAEPELCDLDAAEPDETNVARERRTQMLEMLSKLVRSPVFPRDEDKKEGESAQDERTAYWNHSAR